MQYSLPAEWYPQSAVQLTWPHKKSDWQPWLKSIQAVYVQLAKAITRYQRLVIACHDQKLKSTVSQLLENEGIDMAQVRVFVAPCNDTWARDHGPITLVDAEGQTKILDFTFNAWGDKYAAMLDDKITQTLIQQPFCQLENYQSLTLVLEGGSIESDGRGTLLTTETCLLNPNRNADLSKDELEASLKAHLGMKQIIWLKHGALAGDDTDAHIDTLARFAPKGIVYVQCQDETDPHFTELNKMAAELKAARDIEGKAYNLFPLPWPSPIFNDEGEQLPATYANYLVINGAVLVPVYNDDKDALALAQIGEAHPGLDIIGIDCRTVIQQFGSLHCLTMQIPKPLIQ